MHSFGFGEGHRTMPSLTPALCRPVHPKPAVGFRNGLEARLGIELPGTLVFDYPTISAIARHVSTLIAPAGTASPSAAAGGADAAFLSSLLDAFVMQTGSFLDLMPAGSSSGSATVAVCAVAVRQPAGIMAGGDPTRCAWIIFASSPQCSCLTLSLPLLATSTPLPLCALQPN